MNNEEIKEILYVLKRIVIGRASRLTCREADKLLDYITNLQEENTKLKELCNKYEEEHKTAFKLWTQEIKKIPTYEEKLELQQRIDKAIEYIENTTYTDITGLEKHSIKEFWFVKELLEILDKEK